MMDKVSKITLVIGLSIWVTLYSLWSILDEPFYYFLGQSIILLSASIALHSTFKNKITAIFAILACNQFIDEVFLYGVDFRWSEYFSVLIIIIYLLTKNDNTKV